MRHPSLVAERVLDNMISQKLGTRQTINRRTNISMEAKHQWCNQLTLEIEVLEDLKAKLNQFYPEVIDVRDEASIAPA